MKHREVLTTGRFFPAGNPPPTTPSELDELRQRLQTFGNTPEEAAAYSRLFDLIVAYTERHRGCELQAQHDLSLALQDRKARIAYSWVEYSVFEDGPFNKAVYGKIKRNSDRILRREIVDRRIREYENRGYEDKAKLLDEHGELDVLEYMKMQPLRSWSRSAEKICTNCGNRMPVVFTTCPRCREEQHWVP